MDVPEIGVRPAAAPALDPTLLALSWPRDRLGPALEALARRAGLKGAMNLPLVDPAADPDADLDLWLPWAAARLDLEAEPVAFPLPRLVSGLAKACPAVLALHHGGELRFLLLLKARHSSAEVIGPDLRVTRCGLGSIRQAVAARFEAPLIPDIDRLLQTAGVSGARRARARSAMLQDRLATQEVGGCWLLRLPATAPFFASLVHAGLMRRLVWVVALLIGVYGVEVLGWALIGAAALDGRLDLGWLVAWLLLLVSGLPLRLCAGWLDATFALDLGRILKRRLLAGALRLRIDEVRQQGAGQLLGRVMESQALESLALNGGMVLVVAVLELAFAGWILSKGAGGPWLVLILLGWLAATLGFCWRYYRRLCAWSAMRLDMTHELVEHMVGHRTRLAQERPGRRDAAEDGVMRDYLAVSRALDGALVPIAAGGAGLWAMLALIGMAPAFVQGSATPAQIAISLGGVGALAQAGIAWRFVSELFHAAGAPAERQPFLAPSRRGEDGSGAKLVDASDLVFRYRPDGPAVLRRLSLTIRSGERILLEGPSGGGKSTLGALLTGLRVPESGLLLLNGLDRPTLGPAWRQLATQAPQFHDNHILAGSLAFNLLMGRAWPASDDDLAAARALPAIRPRSADRPHAGRVAAAGR